MRASLVYHLIPIAVLIYMSVIACTTFVGTIFTTRVTAMTTTFTALTSANNATNISTFSLSTFTIRTTRLIQATITTTSNGITLSIAA